MKTTILYLLLIALVCSYGASVYAQPCWTGGFYNNIANEKLIVTPNGDIFSGTFMWGVFRSTNGGRDWTQMNDGLPAFWVPDLAVSQNGTIYAATFGGGVSRSTDGGQHWTPSSNGVSNRYCSCVTVAPNGHLFVGTNSGIFRSTTGGDSWVLANQGFFPPSVYALFATPDGLLLASGYYAVFRSTDDGDNWTVANSGIQSAPVSSFCVGPNGFLYAGISGGGVYRSTDTGGTWTRLTNGINHVVWDITIDSSHNVLASTSYGIFRSTNNGDQWGPIGLSNTEVRTLAVRSNGELLAGARARRGIFRSSDIGATWVYNSMGYFDKWSQVNSLVVGGRDLFYGTAAGVLRTTDEGASWSSVGLLQDTILALALDADGRVFAGTQTGNVFASNDNGGSWNTGIGLPGDPILSMTVDNCGNLFAGTATQKVFRSTDHATHWFPSGLDLPPSSILSLAANEDNVIFAGTSGSGAFISTDKGDSWSCISSGLTNLYVNAIAVDKLSGRATAGPLYAGTDEGVFISTDNGSTWSSFGLSNEPISSLMAKSDTVVAGTHGNGTYRFPDTTGNWGKLCQYYGSNTFITALGVIRPVHYFAATAGMGVYQIYDTIPTPPLVGVKQERPLPVSFVLHQNYPNPFNPSTVFRFELPVSGLATLQVFDLLGQQVGTLIDEWLPIGEHSVPWDAHALPSGVYFYRLRCGSFTDTKRLVLMR